MNEREEEMEKLFDEKELTQRRKSADLALEQKLSSDTVKHLRRRCKNDLFFLVSGPLGFNKLSPRFHGHLAGWIQKNRSWQNKLILAPRGHYKTTLGSVGESVQMALPCDDLQVEYPHNLGPNTKILIAHEVRETAADILFDIASSFTKKDLMLFLYPELIPKKNVQRLNKWELELPRQKHHKEATFNTMGAGGASQGQHFFHINADDIIGVAARESRTVMDTTIRWWSGINPLLTEFEIDTWTMYGTRYAVFDVYSATMEKYGIDVPNSVLTCIPQKEIDKLAGGMLRVYARGAIENGQPIFPEAFSLARLSMERRDRVHWAAQYANNPVEGGLQEFEWPLKFYNVDARKDIVVFTGDSSFKRHQSELDITIFCDPSMGETKFSDETGIIVNGVDSRHNIFILETIKKRLRPPELVDKLFELYFKYHPRLIAIEEVNFSAIYRYWIEEKCSKVGTYLPIRRYKPGSSRSKEARIRSLAHFFSAGQVYVHEGMHDFRDEYEQFPIGKSQHLLDALAQGPSFWQKGADQRSVDAISKEIDETLYPERNINSGY